MFEAARSSLRAYIVTLGFLLCPQCLSALRYQAACQFLERNNLLSIIRAHEAQDAGCVPVI
jgi:hypothetical protein